MKVKDFISKIVDNYHKIVIEEFDSSTHLIKARYIINPHEIDFTFIPEDIWEMEVGMVVLYCDSLVISVKKGD